MTAPSGNSSSVDPSAVKSTSNGESRFKTAAMDNSGGRMVGKSFIECTAISISPAIMRSSISLTNAPTPATSCNGRSVNVSPLVFMISCVVSTPFSLSRRSTRFACARARPLPRVPIIIFKHLFQVSLVGFKRHFQIGFTVSG